MKIPLTNTRICIDCEVVHDEPICPECGRTESDYSLSRIMGGTLWNRFNRLSALADQISAENQAAVNRATR